MDCGACQPWVTVIEQDFAYLFAEHGFRLEHCEDARQGEHCLIMLGSNRARIKFEISQGTPVVYFGTLDSPIGWEQQVDGVPVWYVDNALLNFVESPNRFGLPAFYELHVWAWKNNPSGMFYEWNPHVSCTPGNDD